jgi:deoxyribose-phosphate aldolase
MFHFAVARPHHTESRQQFPVEWKCGYACGINCAESQRPTILGKNHFMSWKYTDVAKMIDHALLKPTLTAKELEAGCLMARAYGVASVCIMPFAVKQCADLLEGCMVATSTTIGFPHGASAISSKVDQSVTALADGCQELDMVVNISKVLSGDWEYVRAEIAAVVGAAHAQVQRVKVIFETCYLSDDQKVRLCEICGDVGADWVKTSTGFGTGGATVDDLRLMREHSPSAVQVKASGGIRTLKSLLLLRDIGVTRIGTSSTRTILDEARQQLGLSPIESVGPSSETAGY